MTYNHCTILLAFICAQLFGSLSFAQNSESQKAEQDKQAKKQTYTEDFESGMKAWKVTDEKCWKIEKANKSSVLSLFKKQTKYSPKVRSPRHIAINQVKQWKSFQLDVDVLSTHKDYNHRDVCIFFGYQNPSKFYYVHLGKKTDNAANQIFIVNDKPRTKISTKTTRGTNWDNKWHKVRIIRDANSGKIEVFFDNMKKPVMVAENKQFTWGKIGLGSFDDTAQFDNLVIKGIPYQTDSSNANSQKKNSHTPSHQK